MMRPPRTPSFIWLPFVFSLGGLSWGLLVGALALLAALILTPALQDCRAAQVQRNDLQATLALLDQKIDLQKDFIDLATTDPLVMQRLAARQYLTRRDQQPLLLDPAALQRDRSVASLIAESLTPVAPQPVPPVPLYLRWALVPSLRPLLLALALAALALAFVLGVRYQPRTGAVPT